MLGNYVYADGVTNLRVSVAVDALTVRLLEQRDDVALSFLATPTDVFAVPADAVAEARRASRASGRLRVARPPLRASAVDGCCSATTPTPSCWTASRPA